MFPNDWTDGLLHFQTKFTPETLSQSSDTFGTKKKNYYKQAWQTATSAISIQNSVVENFDV